MHKTTLATLETQLSAASVRAKVAHAAWFAASSRLHEDGPPSQGGLDRVALFSQAMVIAAWERDLLVYRRARYRIAAFGWGAASPVERAARHPGPKPWNIRAFAAHHRIGVEIVREVVASP